MTEISAEVRSLARVTLGSSRSRTGLSGGACEVCCETLTAVSTRLWSLAAVMVSVRLTCWPGSGAGASNLTSMTLARIGGTSTICGRKENRTTPSGSDPLEEVALWIVAPFVVQMNSEAPVGLIAQPHDIRLGADRYETPDPWYDHDELDVGALGRVLHRTYFDSEMESLYIHGIFGIFGSDPERNGGDLFLIGEQADFRMGNRQPGRRVRRLDGVSVHDR